MGDVGNLGNYLKPLGRSKEVLNYAGPNASRGKARGWDAESGAGPCPARQAERLAQSLTRVSADAAPHWFPRVSELPLARCLFQNDRTNMPAARNMVRNVAARMVFSRRLWRNDPDCLILRDAGAKPKSTRVAADMPEDTPREAIIEEEEAGGETPVQPFSE